MTGSAVRAASHQQALEALSAHALEVSLRLSALIDHMVALDWGVGGYTRDELREIADELHCASIRATASTAYLVDGDDGEE